MQYNNMDKFYSEFSRIRVQPGTIFNQGKRLKPNEKCPCGSGIKYKKCCQERLENIARKRGSDVVTMNDVTNKPS